MGNFLEVTHPKISPHQACLDVGVLKSGFREKEGALFVNISSHFNPFKLHSSITITPTWTTYGPTYGLLYSWLV